MAKSIKDVNVYVYYHNSGRTTKFDHLEQRTIANQYGATSNYVVGDPGPSGTNWNGYVTARIVYTGQTGGTRKYRARMYIPASAGYSHWYTTVSSRWGDMYSSWSRSVHIYGADPYGNGLYNQGDCAHIYYTDKQDETHDDQPYRVEGHWVPKMTIRNYFASTTTYEYIGVIYYATTSYVTLDFQGTY